MTPLPENDAGVGHSFGLEFDGVLSMVLEVIGLSIQRDVVELKEQGPDGKYHVRRLPGRPAHGEVVLARALTGDTTFETWAQDASFGAAGSVAAVVLFDVDGAAVRRYTLANAWPSKLEFGTLSTGGTEMVIERLTLAHEGIHPG